MTWTRVAAFALASIAGTAPASTAQTPADRLEVAAGINWFGAADYPPVNGTQIAPGGTTRVVFRTESALAASAGLSVRIGVPIVPAVVVESTLSLNMTSLSTHVRDDVEGAPALTASEPVTQYLFEAGVRLGPAGWRRGRFEPFVAAGGGYLRQLNDGRTLVQTGASWYAGVGGHYFLKRRAGRIKSSGLRLDARMSVLSDGVALDGGRHVVPVLGGAVFLRF